jgi:glycosyltransferase involved in cell wall biosynthesis
MMKISLITPVQNGEKTIKRTLKSILAQDYRNVEHIIVDNCSTDTTLSIVGQFHMAGRQIISERDNGLYDAINKGIDLATGEVIGLLHCDDMFADKGVLSHVAKYFESNPSVHAAVGDIAYMKNPPRGEVHRYYRSYPFGAAQLKYGVSPAHTSLFVRSGIFNILGPYDTSFRIAGDFEFFCRLLQHNDIEVGNYNKLCTLMGLNGKSSPNLVNSWRVSKEIMRACKQNAIQTNFAFIHSRFLLKINQFKSSELNF